MWHIQSFKCGMCGRGCGTRMRVAEGREQAGWAVDVLTCLPGGRGCVVLLLSKTRRIDKQAKAVFCVGEVGEMWVYLLRRCIC